MKTEQLNGHKTSVMEKDVKTGRGEGLCSLCTRAQDCTFPSRPLLHGCEEFEGMARSPVDTIEAYMSQEAKRKKQSPPAPSSLKGLCRNCEILEGCTYSKPEGGVWHCEEYR